MAMAGMLCSKNNIINDRWEKPKHIFVPSGVKHYSWKGLLWLFLEWTKKKLEVVLYSCLNFSKDQWEKKTYEKLITDLLRNKPVLPPPSLAANGRISRMLGQMWLLAAGSCSQENSFDNFLFFLNGEEQHLCDLQTLGHLLIHFTVFLRVKIL